MEAIKNGAILVLAIFFSSCNKGKGDEKNLPENGDLKIEVYNKLNELINNKDSIFSFRELNAGDFDTLLIFPSYTSLAIIKSNINKMLIDGYEQKLFLDESDNLIIFSKHGKPLYFFDFDSIYIFPDITRNSFSAKTKFKLQPYDRTNGGKGAYMIPILEN